MYVLFHWSCWSVRLKLLWHLLSFYFWRFCADFDFPNCAVTCGFHSRTLALRPRSSAVYYLTCILQLLAKWPKWKQISRSKRALISFRPRTSYAWSSLLLIHFLTWLCRFNWDDLAWPLLTQTEILHSCLIANSLSKIRSSIRVFLLFYFVIFNRVPSLLEISNPSLLYHSIHLESLFEFRLFSFLQSFDLFNLYLSFNQVRERRRNVLALFADVCPCRRIPGRFWDIHIWYQCR